MKEKIDKLKQLKMDFAKSRDNIQAKYDEIFLESQLQQQRYDAYFDLYKELDPKDIPNDMEPTIIPIIIKE